eukprot:g2070.t2
MATLLCDPVGPDAKSHALSRTERRKLKVQARTDALKPMQQKLQSKDTTALENSMLAYLLAVCTVAIFTIQVNLLAGGEQWLAEGQRWVLLGLTAGMVVARQMPNLVKWRLNGLYILFDLATLLYVTPWMVPPEKFVVFTMVALAFIRMPAVVFATSMPLVLAGNLLR